MGNRTKVCPRCHATYDESRGFCERDGAALVDDPSEAQSVADRRTRRVCFAKETLVGLAIVAVLAGTVAAFALYRQSRVFVLHLSFEDGAGLKVGDSVFLRGADVGEVTDTRLENGRFLATIHVRPDAVEDMRETNLFFIAYDKLFLNRKCIRILGLGPESPLLKSGQMVKGIDSSVEFYGTLLRTQGPREAAEFMNTLKRMLTDGGLPVFIKELAGENGDGRGK